MQKHKRFVDEFTWIPIDKRPNPFDLPGWYPRPYRKPELRKPKYWLARNGGELYFVNNTDEVLDFVSTKTGGFLTADDDIVTLGCKGYSYNEVMPLEAVKIEEFDGYFDLDYVIQVDIFVKSKKEGSLKIQSPAKKGGVGETVLLWDTGEEGKFVSIHKE